MFPKPYAKYNSPFVVFCFSFCAKCTIKLSNKNYYASEIPLDRDTINTAAFFLLILPNSNCRLQRNHKTNGIRAKNRHSVYSQFSSVQFSWSVGHFRICNQKCNQQKQNKPVRQSNHQFSGEPVNEVKCKKKS